MAKAEAQIESVTMKDGTGRIVDFAGKRKLIKDSFVKDGQVSIRLDFRNGESRTFVLPDSLLLKFAAHGAEQKLGDEIAGLNEVDDAVLAVDALIDRLNKGEWSVAREANGMAGTSVLLRALVEMYGGKKSVDQLKTFLAGKSQAEKVALRNNPKVKPIVEKLEAEKAAKANKVDTDKLLDELDGEAATGEAASA